MSQSTDPATGQVIYHGVAEDGSGATVQIYGQGDGQLAVQRGPAVPMVRRAPAFRHRARRQAMRRQWTRQRLAERGRRFRGRDRHHGRGCRR